MKDILSLVERVARRRGPSDDADLREYCAAGSPFAGPEKPFGH